MASQVSPEADVKNIKFATTDNKTDWGFITPPLLYQESFPPDDSVLERFSQKSDLILAPIRSTRERGLILLKAVWLKVTKRGNPIYATLKVYEKGNTPQDGSADTPTYQTTFQLQNGNVFINTPHLLSEAFVLRFQWEPDVFMPPDGKVIYGGQGMEAKERILNKVRIHKIFVDIEEYGERENVTGTDYPEQEW